MADESIIVEVTDKVATGPADKFRDMAEQAIKAASSVDTLKSAINGLPTSSVQKIASSLTQIANATTKVTSAEIKMSAEAGKAALVQQRLATEIAKTSRAEALAEATKARLAAATNKTQVAQKQLSETQAEAVARIAKTVTLTDSAAESQRKYAMSLDSATKAVKAEGQAENQANQARSNTVSSRNRDTQAAQEQYNASLAQAQAATRAARDTISANEKQAASSKKTVDGAKQQVAQLVEVGKQAKLSRNQILTLQYTASDIVASLGSGISPMTIALQQGPQVAQVFTKEIGRLATSVGALGGVAAVTAAAIGGLAIVYDRAAAEAAKLNNAVTVTNNYAGITADNFRQMAEGIANAANTSVSAAKDVELAFVSSGRFQREVIEQNSVSVLKLAKLTDQSADDIAKAFNQMADSPTAFAESLNKSYHFLDSAQLTQIRNLEDIGEKTKATEMISRALYDYLGNVGDAELGPLAGAWDVVSKAITGAGLALKDFVYGAGPTARLSEISMQLQAIANSQKANPNSPSDQLRIEQLNKEYGLLASQIALKEEDAKKQSDINRVQAEGYEASKRISNEYLKTVDNVSAADKAVKKFRDSIKSALAADSNDKAALAAQAKAAQIEKKLREDNMPETKKGDKTGESRALAIAKINAELQKQVDGLGVLKPQRELQQQLDQYEIDLASRKIKLSADERKSIEDKLKAIQDYNSAQQATDRIFEETTGPLRDYNATLTASNALLKAGTIDQTEHAKQVTKASEQYKNSVDPLRQTNIQLDQQADLLKQIQPEREISQQMQQVENQLRSQGLSLIDATTGALTKEGAALQQKLVALQQLTAIQQQYDAIYAQTAGAEASNRAAIEATTLARQNGIISAEQYGIKLNQLAVQAAQIRIAAGNVMPGDAALASFGAIIEGYQGLLSGLSDSFGSLFVNITDGFANAIAGAIMGTESLGDALRNVAQQAVQQLIASLIKLGIQYAVNAAIGQSLGAAGVASSIAMGSATAVAWAPAAAAVSLATLGANGAPAVAAISSANVASTSFALAGFSKGGYTGDVGRGAVAGVVHGQEFVMNAEATQRIGVGNLQAMQDGRSNAVQSTGSTKQSVGSGDGPRVTLTVINNSNNSQTKQESSEDADGNVDMVVTIDTIENALASRVSSGRGPLSKSISTGFGLSPKPQGART